MRIFIRICFIWTWLVILIIPCAQTLDTHSEQTGNTFVVKVWLIWLWRVFFLIHVPKQPNSTQRGAYDNRRQSFCLCRNLFHQDWFWPLKRQANWINMMFPVLPLSALLNPWRLTVWFLMYSEAAAKTNSCDSLLLPHGARWMPLFFRDGSILKKPFSIRHPSDYVKINSWKWAGFWNTILLLIKRVRLAVARQNKISLFFKTGCPRAVPLQGFSVSKNPDPSPCHKVLFVNKTDNPNLTSCGLTCVVQDRRVCLWFWWEGPCLRSTAMTCSRLCWIV